MCVRCDYRTVNLTRRKMLKRNHPGELARRGDLPRDDRLSRSVSYFQGGMSVTNDVKSLMSHDMLHLLFAWRTIYNDRIYILYSGMQVLFCRNESYPNWSARD